VGEDLARALASLLCRTKHSQAAACTDCSASGTILAPHVGRALFASRLPGRGSLLKAQDYDAIGRALDVLERLAETPVGRRFRAR
jgi:hypothetical protein